MKAFSDHRFLLWLLLLFPFLGGCNNSDDITAIFTGKKWKLTLITIDGQSSWPMLLWANSNTSYETSMKHLTETAGSYTVQFNGIVQDHQINGALNGTFITNTFSGTWSANDSSREFSAAVNGSPEADVLAQTFATGLKTAHAYEGDTEHLYLLYRVGAVTYRMFFRPAAS
ncbi:DUF4847 family protein [Bacteroides heparinolyticus]|uniref:DUF4847 family protein n=1 Tax=Prevotella heparinolytica TaxID=28113 RepID=UPI00359F6704